jgi:hypothetical protein
MTTDLDSAVVEAAARASFDHGNTLGDETWEGITEADRESHRELARAMLAAVTSLSAGRSEPSEDRFNTPDWLVWSHHHGMWHGPNGSGYRRSPHEAGRFTWAEAQRICSLRSWPDEEHPPEVAVLASLPRLPDGLMEVLIQRATSDAVAHRAAEEASHA